MKLILWKSSDEVLSDASSINQEDVLSDGSTTLSPLSDIEYDHNGVNIDSNV